MLGQVTAVRIGNQKLISIDSIALFGIIGLLAVIGAVLTDKYQTDEDNYLANFKKSTVTLSGVDYNDTCYMENATLPDSGQGCDLTVTVTVDCTVPTNPPCDVMDADLNPVLSYGSLQQFQDAINRNNLTILFDMSVSSLTEEAWYNSENHADYRVFGPPACRKWCTAQWMFRLCVAVAGLCVGFSGLVFLYLYLGCILERLYPRRRLQRLANLLLMQGEEAPKLDRPNTSSKSESIRPDLKEY